mmetsp:Transcript_12944/g.24659  ORF Transcript_12944/g.24659 Transcript_12944/m.24659 type:complete len:186 (+) Transcript_12944:59-616(+)|eukprot:CAMPEP_0114245344 /NCGR_PEP_ID=MMETSP0058-20121206/11840_1 /TAXON_ID=36894 /ORGANISM="Pyramimonas parkeae, CCMP726" /LENGTH=185 /DNA_ID=CAMNT_0001358379 /DNA_START=57 /DNA_END=614 /DNA_ORIENTATION=-
MAAVSCMSMSLAGVRAHRNLPCRSSSRAAPPRVRAALRSNLRTGLTAKVKRSVAVVAPRLSRAVVVRAEDKQVAYNKQFGYSRKDVILIGGAVLLAGFGSYYGMLAAGVDMVVAGNIELVVFTLGMTIAWTASYVFRVANKDMTYVKQLKDYEDAVMAKRLEEMPVGELDALMSELEEDSPTKKK